MTSMLTSAEKISVAIRLGREMFPILNSSGMGSTIIKDITSSAAPINLLHFAANFETKILGLCWSCSSNSLVYSIFPSKFKRHSKRSGVLYISGIFYPLELLSQSAIIAKIILEELWTLKLSWD